MTTTTNDNDKCAGQAQNKTSSDILYLYGALTTKSYVYAAMVTQEETMLINVLCYNGLTVSIKRENTLDDPYGYPAGFDIAAYATTNQKWAPAPNRETQKWRQPHNRPVFVAFRSKEYAVRYATHTRLLDEIYKKIRSESAVQEIEKWCKSIDDLTRLARDIGCPELEPTMVYGESITDRPLELAYLYDATNPSSDNKISRVFKTPDIAAKETDEADGIPAKSVRILSDGISYRVTGYDPEKRCYTELKANDKSWIMDGSKMVFLDEDDAVYYALVCEIKKGVAAGIKENVRVPDGVYNRTNVTSITLPDLVLTKVAKKIADWLMPIRSKNK